MINRRCRLPAVDDLEVGELRYSLDPAAAAELNTGCSGGYPVVVREEPSRVLDQRAPDPLVDRAPCLQERADVALEQARAILAVKLGEEGAGEECEVDAVVGAGRAGKAGQRVAEFCDRSTVTGSCSRPEVSSRQRRSRSQTCRVTGMPPMVPPDTAGDRARASLSSYMRTVSKSADCR